MNLSDCLSKPLHEILPALQQRITDGRTTYFGIPTYRSPIDHWVYQELIHASRPDIIVEIGMLMGGQTLALAHLCDAMNHGMVIGVEINPGPIHQIVREHPRVRVVEGDALDPIVFEKVIAFTRREHRVMVIEDSAHTYENTLGVLRRYSTLCKPGDWCICEDTICWHGLNVGPRPGPYEAVETFLSEHPEFDRQPDPFPITWNPGGYLRRKS